MVRKYYEILGITEDSSQKEINEAYRKLSFKWHPDLFFNKSEKEKKEAEEKMSNINQAYETLKDTEKRKNYDRYGDEKGFGGFGQGSSSSEVFEDVLQTFFGFSSNGKSSSGSSSNHYNYDSKKNKQQKFQSPDDILVNISLNFRESVLGTKKEIEIPLKRSCSKCNQKGYESPSDIAVCPYCKGSGTILTSIGFFQMNSSCSRCLGTGSFVNRKCSVCKGQLFINRKERIIINIPKGIQLDKRIRYQGIGNDGINSKRGDIYADIKVEKHPYYFRKGNDVYSETPISFLDAILGSTIEAITLEGIEQVIVPQGTQNNDYVVIKNKGCYLGTNSNSRGNFYVMFQIRLPKKLSNWSKELLEGLRNNTNKSWNPNREFIERNKNL